MSLNFKTVLEAFEYCAKYSFNIYHEINKDCMIANLVWCNILNSKGEYIPYNKFFPNNKSMMTNFYKNMEFINKLYTKPDFPNNTYITDEDLNHIYTDNKMELSVKLLMKSIKAVITIYYSMYEMPTNDKINKMFSLVPVIIENYKKLKKVVLLKKVNLNDIFALNTALEHSLRDYFTIGQLIHHSIPASALQNWKNMPDDNECLNSYP